MTRKTSRSLDQISAGRAGWNLVTSNNEVEAFNHDREKHAAHADRYDWLPGSPTDFLDMVIAELQRRGFFQTEYEGKTLREKFGLPTPISRWQSGPVVAE
jgi:hypothetical protein